MGILGRKTVKTEKTSAPMVKASKSSKAAASKKAAPSHDEIAKRSYELFLARGGEHGHAEEDWLTAERELSN
jgi:hypothetical protein